MTVVQYTSNDIVLSVSLPPSFSTPSPPFQLTTLILCLSEISPHVRPHQSRLKSIWKLRDHFPNLVRGRNRRRQHSPLHQINRQLGRSTLCYHLGRFASGSSSSPRSGVRRDSLILTFNFPPDLLAFFTCFSPCFFATDLPPPLSHHPSLWILLLYNNDSILRVQNGAQDRRVQTHCFRDRLDLDFDFVSSYL